MSSTRVKNLWSKLPLRGALALGLGAFFASGAQSPTQAGPSSNDAAIRIDGDAISISQNGGAFEELRLGNTPEAAYLRKLLQEAGAGAHSVTVPVGSMIVASGGGSGKGSKPKQQTEEQSATEKGS
jgi:hypothetical protein